MKKMIIAVLILLLVGLVDMKPIDLSSMQKQIITVYVDGAVQHPGLIELERYATSQDALDIAIPLENADLSGINPLTILKDADRIVIPEVNTEMVAKISINTASLEELCTLEGIGEGTAQKIITYRNENGYFQTLEDLTKVSGIGQAKLTKIIDRICL